MIIQGDCVDLLKTIEAETIDMVLTSPPYDSLRDYEDLPFDKFQIIAAAIQKVIKPGGIIVWIVNDATINGSETGTSFRQALYFKEIGLNIHDTMIYQKSGMTFPETNRYYPNFEYMFVLSKGKPITTNLLKDRKNLYAGFKNSSTQREKNGTTRKQINAKLGKEYDDYGVRMNVWQFETGFNKSTQDPEAYDHPAIFPERLAEDHILSWTNPKETVLDPFMGSGTTGKMCFKHNRKFIGFEINPKYFQIAKIRIEDAEKEPPLFYDE